jgi:thioredoxin-dependent peroxiredoxin
VRRLTDYAGTWLVVYFYPKDDTPGCTIQGKAFTLRKADFEKRGVSVLGVSADDVASHKSFCDKFGFTTTFLADPDAGLMKGLGLAQSEWNGVKYWDRASLIVDPQGVIRKTYVGVKPQGHDDVLLEDIAALQGAVASRSSESDLHKSV